MRYRSTRDDQKVLGPCALEMTENKNCAIITQYNLPCLDTLSPPLFQFFLSLQNRRLLPGPQVLINSIYDAFIAFKISELKTYSSPKGLNMENTGDEEGP